MKTNIFFKLQLLFKTLVLLFLIVGGSFSSEPHCSQCEYGYRRMFSPTAIIKTSDTTNWDAENLFFKHVASEGEALRANLIDRGVFGTAEKDKKVEIDSHSARNVAAFAFVFFDSAGSQVGEKPFYYRPSGTKQNIQEPFFFFSGRCHLPYDAKSDTYSWCSLSETAIKVEDGNLLDIQQPSQSRKKTFRYLHGAEFINLLESIGNIYIAESEKLVWKTCDTHQFFDQFNKRNKEADKAKGKEELCELFLNPTLLQVREIKPDPKKVSHYLPSISSQEMYFTHSEQFAFFKMGLDFDGFINSCKEDLGEDANNISKVALLVYSRNTICARCGHSLIVDFCKSNESFLTKFISPFEQSLQFVFLASSLYPYQSAVDRKDNFEYVLSQIDSHTISPDNPFHIAARKVDINERMADKTMTDQNIEITFEDSPSMIYHHHMSPKPAYNISSQTKDPSQGNSPDTSNLPSHPPESRQLPPPNNKTDQVRVDEIRERFSNSFANPLQPSDLLEPFVCLTVYYGDEKPQLPGLFDKYVVGPTIGKGECFFHAGFTEFGQTKDAVEAKATKIRSALPTVVRSKPEYIDLMRAEVLAELKTSPNKYKEKGKEQYKDLLAKIEENTRHEIAREYVRMYLAEELSQGLFKKPHKELLEDEKNSIQDEVLVRIPVYLKNRQLYTDDEIKAGISDAIVEQYVSRYSVNTGDASCYVEFPVGRNIATSIANIIASSNDVFIHCFMFDKEKKVLSYVSSIGVPTSVTIVSILYFHQHFWTLYHPDMPEVRKNGMIQAAFNKYNLSESFL
jgi:hypothetical protein